MTTMTSITREYLFFQTGLRTEGNTLGRRKVKKLRIGRRESK
jgi:hypothetical protein